MFEHTILQLNGYKNDAAAKFIRKPFLFRYSNSF